MRRTHSELETRLALIGRSRLPGQLTPTAPSLAPSLVSSLSAPRPGRRQGRRAHAFCRPVGYTLPGVIPAIQQSAPATAWAAQAAMMLAWRDDRPYTVEQALAVVQPRWVEAYRRGDALSADDTALFLATAGLCAAPPQSLSAEGWEALLRTYGPLCLLPADAEVVLPAPGRMVTSIQGDGTPEGTQLGFVDSSTGTGAAELLSAFAAPLRVLHWSIDAGLARGARPTALPAPETPATPPPAGPSTASSVRARRYARASAVPEWDRPANFPAAIRQFWGRPASRLHHFLWHLARSAWPNLEPAWMRAFTDMKFTPPPRLAGQPGAGIDFLGMHRRMIDTTRAIAARAKLAYRPTAWRPIPWNHLDPDWPMPVLSGGTVPVSKTERRTAEMRTIVANRFENDAWLAGVSLDELGNLVENSIHGWMHMHWAADPPAPFGSPQYLQAVFNSDYLGDTPSSQVNPHFWKLHGWVDECISRWENAPVAAGTGQKRDATSLLAPAWLGPVPAAPTAQSLARARARALELEDPMLHEHGGMSDDEALRLIAALEPSRHDPFPGGSSTTEELVALLGPIGDVPEAWIAEAGGADPTSAMASLRARPAVVALDRHGVRQMALPAVVGEIGLAVFSAAAPSIFGGDVSYEVPPITEYYHPNTPPETPALRSMMDIQFATIADPPPAIFPTIAGKRNRLKTNGFYFELRFDHNGYDIRKCNIEFLRGKSSTLYLSSFDIKFRPVEGSDRSHPVASILYMISGRWDPAGIGDYSFQGELLVRADGSVSAKITRADEATVEVPTQDGITNVRRVALPTPTVLYPTWEIYFSPEGSAVLSESAADSVLAWLDNQLLTDAAAGLRNGTTPIEIHGYASTKDKKLKNLDLSRDRAVAVEKLIRNYPPLGPNARIDIYPHGERDAGTPDDRSDSAQQKVMLRYKHYRWPTST